MVSRGSSPFPGQWDSSRAPYQIEIMDAVLDCPEVVACTSSQIGKTEIVNNILGYYVHQDPAPILVVMPTDKLGEAWSKDRLAPMIAETPVLRVLVSDAKSRDSGNTIMHKQYPGGQITAVGANTPANLAMRPVRIVLCDEVDRFPRSAGTEGDPIALAFRRTDAYWNRRLVQTSTPTVTGLSKIEGLYLASDMRRFHVPCPACGRLDVLTFSGWVHHAEQKDGGHFRVEWEDADDPFRSAASARIVCSCGARLGEEHKRAMLAGGRWIAEKPERSRRGYHLNALYSPWRRVSEVVKDFLDAKHGGPETLKTFVNTVLGESWREDGDASSVDGLKARRASYFTASARGDAEVPDGVGALTCAVDVQSDRLEATVWGWGPGEECWLIAFEQIMGNPSSDLQRKDGLDPAWIALDQFRRQKFLHESGRALSVDITVVDSAFATEHVYRYCATRSRENVHPIRGAAEQGKPFVMRPSDKNRYHIKLWPLCVDSGKEVMLARLNIPTPGPGYVHLPEWIDDEFVEQLCSEVARREYKKGRGVVRVWEKIRERNEAWDLILYGLAGLYMLGATFARGLRKRADDWSARVDPATHRPAPAAPARPARRPGKTPWFLR